MSAPSEPPSGDKSEARQISPIVELARSGPDRKIGILLSTIDKNGRIQGEGGSNFKYNGRQYAVPRLPQALQDSLILPDAFHQFGSTRKLFDSILALFQEHTAISEQTAALLTYWSISTWFPDFVSFFPTLELEGSVPAVDVLFRTMRAVCRRSILIADFSSALFRTFPIGELMPTLLIRDSQLNKKMASLLDASTQPGYLVSTGKDLQRLYCPKCVYVGDAKSDPRLAKTSIQIHIDVDPGRQVPPPPKENVVREFQNRLITYRLFAHDKVAESTFRVSGFRPEVRAIAEVLGATVVDDEKLQNKLIDLLKERDEQSRVDHSVGLKGAVVRAVLSHCHQRDQEKIYVRDIAATVNQIYSEEGESVRVNSETVGHVLKSLGLYSRRLGNAGRGLMLEKSLQSHAHRLGSAYDVLPAEPACGFCQTTQISDSKGLV
jgi:hypothetical protein